MLSSYNKTRSRHSRSYRSMLLLYSFQFRPAFLPRRQACRNCGVPGFPNFTFSRKRTLSSVDLELWHMTLTCEPDRDSIKWTTMPNNLPQSQRSYTSSKIVVVDIMWTHTHTHTADRLSFVLKSSLGSSPVPCCPRYYFADTSTHLYVIVRRGRGHVALGWLQQKTKRNSWQS